MKEQLVHVLEMNEYERQLFMSEKETELIEQLVQNIGVPDDELRDKITYRLFIELLSSQMISNEQMAHLSLQLINSNYLYRSIGEGETDSVFTRSFSALWLTALINVDSQLHFLTSEEGTNILEACSFYLNREKDTRGFLNEKGWALAISNGADLSSAIITHPSYELKFAPRILEGIKTSFWKGSVFINDEEEKFVSVIDKLIQRDFPQSILTEWVEQVFDKLQFSLMTTGYTNPYFAARTNTLHFMKHLYFHLKFTKHMPELKELISLLINKWMKQ